MSKVLELSDDTYQQFTALAARQHRTPEDMLRLCVAAYEAGHHAGAEPLMTEAEGSRAIESPVVLASQRTPERRFPGVVRTIRASDQTLALTDDEWHTLGLEETPDA